LELRTAGLELKTARMRFETAGLKFETAQGFGFELQMFDSELLAWS
jgi:hypothetical protein